jgi:hypothetical protein
VELRTRQDLAEALPQDGVGAEIGVHLGDFAESLLQLARPRQLFLLDHWLPVAPKDKKRVIPPPEADARYIGVLRRFRREVLSGRVVVVRADSVRAMEFVPDLDWVYIDGDHTFHGCLRDLKAALRVVRPGGVIAGHDYHIQKRFGCLVKPAVDHFVSEHPGRVTLEAVTQDGPPSFFLRVLEKRHDGD